MSDVVVRYELDDGTTVGFVTTPVAGFHPAAADGTVIARIQDAIEPSMRAARVVLNKLKELAPDEAEVTFGIKVGGETSWLVAKGSTEANFQVKLRWKSPPSPSPDE